jgi:hypothetical protein
MEIFYLFHPGTPSTSWARSRSPVPTSWIRPPRVAMTGGFTERAAPNRTKVIRTHVDGRQDTIVVDLNEVVKRGRKEKDLS